MTRTVSENHVAGKIMIANVNANIMNGVQAPNIQSSANDSSGALSPSTNGSEKLDRVREIIFGQQTREYQQLFDTMIRDIARLQQEVHHLNEQLLAQKQTHGNQIQALSLQFIQNLKAVEEQQHIKYAEIDEKQNHDIQELQGTVRRIQDELYSEIRQTSERLGAEKTDRTVLGDLLIELGTNLREDSSNGLMEGLLAHLDEDL